MPLELAVNNSHFHWITSPKAGNSPQDGVRLQASRTGDQSLALRASRLRVVVVTMITTLSLGCLTTFYKKIDVCLLIQFLPLDEAIASKAVFVIVSGSDGRAGTLLEPAK